MVDDITPGGAGSGEGEDRAAAIHFVTRSVTDEEAAAVTAVLLAALDEGSPEASVAEPVRDRWVQSANVMRTPFPVGPGHWARSRC